MNRPEAFDKTKHLNDEYKDFIDYMSNSEKSDGLFSSDKNILNNDDKEKFRQLEAQSQKEGCPKYFGVISFDNSFLKKYDLMNEKEQINVDKLKKIGRTAINEMIDKSDKLVANNVYWNAAIHTNTDNIHIHYSICEYHRLEDRKKTCRTKDLIEVEALDSLKSKVINKVVGSQQAQEINELVRQQILPEFKTSLADELHQLIEFKNSLPSNVGLQYNRRSFEPYRKSLDKLTNTIISNSPTLRILYKRFEKQLDEQSEVYKELYGDGKRHLYENFSKNRKEDFYARAGNIILNELKNLQPFSKTEVSKKFGSENSLEFSEQPERDNYVFVDEPITEIPPQIDEESIALVPDDLGGIRQKEKNVAINWSDSYKEACKILYGKKSTLSDYETAEKLLLAEANIGNVIAIHDLGKFYANKKFGKLDEEKSESYYKLALQGFLEIEPTAKKLQPYVQYRIGKMYSYGLGTEQDYEKAFEYFLSSAEKDNKYAQFSLANMSYYGNGVERDLGQAYSWYLKSATKGQPYSAYAVAQMYSKGEYVSKDENIAQEYYQQALSGFLKLEKKEQADDNLFYKIGMMYKNALGTEQDCVKAFDYLKRSAELNNKNGLYEYAKNLLTGEILPQDTKKAVEMLEKSVELGNQNAKRFLAMEYISGKRISQKVDKGLSLLTECADNGDKFSCYSLGKIYLQGEIVQKDLNRAEKYLLSADDNEFTQYSLGKLYLSPEKYDIKKALTYLEKSAEKNMWASYRLGCLYYYGSSELERDTEKGMNWFEKSAIQGNQFAKSIFDRIKEHNEISDFISLGLKSFSQRDYKTAREYFAKASEHGNMFAKKNFDATFKAEQQAGKKKSSPAVGKLSHNINTLRKIEQNMEAHTQMLLAQYDYEFDRQVQMDSFSYSI